MTRHARRSASRVRPACRCNAPQQSPPRAGRATSAPVARITRRVDRWVSRSQASITQPVKHHADGLPPRGTSSGVAIDRADNVRQAEPARDDPQSLQRRQATQVAASSNQ